MTEFLSVVRKRKPAQQAEADQRQRPARQIELIRRLAERGLLVEHPYSIPYVPGPTGKRRVLSRIAT